MLEDFDEMLLSDFPEVPAYVDAVSFVNVCGEFDLAAQKVSILEHHNQERGERPNDTTDYSLYLIHGLPR